MLRPTALPLAELENATEFTARHLGIEAYD